MSQFVVAARMLARRTQIVIALCAATSGAIVAIPGSARADRRSFTRTYEYLTMPKGGLELEFYNTQSTAVLGEESPSDLKTQVEIEYGITDRWDVSIYQVYKQSTNPMDAAASKPFGYAETKLRSRLRLGDRGASFVDTLLYLELIKALGVSEYKVEPKLILARDFGQATLAVNLIGEVELSEGETVFVPGWAAGLTYEIVPAIKLGAETFGELDLESNEVEAYAGPSISWGPSQSFWVAVNAGFGVTESAKALSVQAIFALGIR